MSRICRAITFPHRMKRHFSRLPERPCKDQQEQENREEREGETRTASCASASLPRAQEARGNNRQERKDAVSGREDGSREAGSTLARRQDWTRKEIIRIWRKVTVAEVYNVKPASAIAWQISPHCQQHLRGSHVLDDAEKMELSSLPRRVHPGEKKNGKGRNCDAEQPVKTWRQWCHTST